MAWRALLLLPLAVAAANCRRAEPASRAVPATVPATVTVAAAADLARAFHEVGEAFEKRSGSKVTFQFGSTGLLARQIIAGAPFDLFAAADQSFVDEVTRAGACDDATRALYARGRIVVYTKHGGSVARPTTLADLADARFVKIAIANPEHAPYGRAAEQALRHAGIWEAVRARLVYGENVQQALQFAESGNAEAAIVALSLAVTSDGESLPIDPATYPPLDQALVICRHGAAATQARELVRFINSPDGRAIMRRYGFWLPGEVGSSAHP